MPDTLRARMADGEVVNNGWLSMADTFGAELMAQSGWDSLTLDMQHGLIGYGEMVHILQTLQRFDLPVLVRTPWKDLATISRCLDAGANGVIAPMINTVAEARDLVSASRFTPVGARSHGPVRAAAYGTGGTYYKTANSDILVLAMIETPEGLANLDGILAVEGIDGLFVGPGDFGLCLGFPPTLDRREPEVLEAYKSIVAKARAANKIPGIHNASAEYSAEMTAMGFQFHAVLSDGALLQRAATAQVEAFRATVPGTVA
jgi:4-hydroxy-2-oxoheptanedioate aldolase